VWTLHPSYPLSVLAKQFEFDLDAAFANVGPRYNIAPSQDVLAVRVIEPGASRELSSLHWGLVPSWAKGAKIGYSTINARADTVATKPAFRAAFKKRRCLERFQVRCSGDRQLANAISITKAQPAFAASHATPGCNRSRSSRRQFAAERARWESEF
jgi:hypothetical protein